MEYVTLNDGNKIPQFGLGVYQVPEGEATINSVKTALEMGVRHIDTAHAYQTERSVGRAVKESGIQRKEIWITTKLWPSEYGEGKTSQAIDKMLKRLDTDYIDLLLYFGLIKYDSTIIVLFSIVCYIGSICNKIIKQDEQVYQSCY